MATHILTVNETTFKTHLKYMFIGTGSDGYAHQNGALADILSIRENDNIIFYVMNVGFFGIFKAVGNVFYDYNSYTNFNPQYLDSQLGGKTLTYRVRIKPFQVYKKSISEWDMMENPLNIKDNSIFNMQWSWIFKKLNANRGCLSIDNEEYTLFLENLQNNNSQIDNVYNYNYQDGILYPLNNDNIKYDINCTTEVPRIEDRLNRINIEEDLRILFTAKGNTHTILNKVLNPASNGNINFISNEVLCSFSERKMDLLLGTDQNKCLLIELKNYFVFNGNIYNQIKEYGRWVCAYKKQYNEVIPILILKAPKEVAKRKNSKYYKYLSKSDKENNITSIWYNDITSEINHAKIKLKNENIDKLSELEVYIFFTNTNDELIDFKKI
ncbi:hypothetical protein CRU99_04545 [Malaciobacter mytili]|uniref:hypothetical protein n=1 Tax=Malaciobacter mytili TaxID=603050 RepID=UPI00100ABF24|nr:hypothetical protein [Malaciobacter mytili]RXI44850.1 hypothetical protein CRU99_04545 [Malaciobacter mytili]